MMKKLLIAFMIQGIWLTMVISAEAQNTWTFELLGGDAYCFNTPLTIKQSGYEDITFTAKYKTNSFEPPIYYSYRFALWTPDRAWELELVHLKIELTNPPSEVQHFEISHGYNLLMLNRAWKRQHVILRVGGGIVISHPENTVRGKSLPWNKGILKSGYHLSGVSTQVDLGRRFYFGKHVFLTLDGKLTGSYARVPVEEGHADVPNVAIHGLVGVGWEF
jgi:hypothetical protein